MLLHLLKTDTICSCMRIALRVCTSVLSLLFLLLLLLLLLMLFSATGKGHKTNEKKWSNCIISGSIFKEISVD